MSSGINYINAPFINSGQLLDSSLWNTYSGRYDQLPNPVPINKIIKTPHCQSGWLFELHNGRQLDAAWFKLITIRNV